MTVGIPLTRGLFALVDDNDAAVVGRFKWHAKASSTTTYAVRWHRPPDGKLRMQALHQLLTGWALTDHINGNGLDNRRSNLRPATDQQNLRNMRKHRGSSRFKGVSLHKSTGLWRAEIYLDYKAIWLGRFDLEEDAARAYDAAARKHFGKFAALNFPEPDERSALID